MYVTSPYAWVLESMLFSTYQSLRAPLVLHNRYQASWLGTQKSGLADTGASLQIWHGKSLSDEKTRVCLILTKYVYQSTTHLHIESFQSNVHTMRVLLIIISFGSRIPAVAPLLDTLLFISPTINHTILFTLLSYTLLVHSYVTTTV